ncbi:maleylacetoacetate isomerase [Methylocystis sp. JAN1]|uniref:maleylacetoacetate isomerase n=1 Tax=Methylocystis sp. JAN1 TaxID=3397211 RepID=UPI003FA3218E
MILYDYWRSSAAYRVRIALALKGLAVERRFVHLLRDGGEQRSAAYREKNPQGLAPALELDDGRVLTQSLAIIDYLDAIRPQPPLTPSHAVVAARARAVALIVACEIHPLGNLRVTDYLRRELKLDRESVETWRRHWITAGFEAIEAMIAPAPFCFTDTPSLADICLAPQVFNAERFGVLLEPYPKIRQVADVCAAHPAFAAAHPSRQPDAEPTSPAP